MKWSEKEIKYLSENWTKERKEKILQELEKRDWKSIQNKAYRLGLKGRKNRLSISEKGRERRRKQGKASINHIEITPKIKELIQSLTLGDGYLTNGKSVSLETTDKNLDYLEYLGGLCKSLKISYNIDRDHNAFRLRTSSYREFRKFKERFYPVGRKIIPKDFKITPFKLRTWFIDDGWSNNYAIYIGAISRSEEELRNIQEQMKDKEIKMNIQGIKNNKLRLYCGKDRHKFYNFIGKCPVKCYQYKWKI